MKTPTVPKPAQRQTVRFEERRERILAAAATLINQHGVRGMTFADVARLVPMNQHSIAYYFKRRQMLAAAAFTDTIERMEMRIDAASTRPDARSRIAHYLQLGFASQRRLRLGEDRPMTALMDVLSLEDPYRSALTQRYRVLFYKVRDLFGPAQPGPTLTRNSARALLLLESMLWLPLWLHFYSLDDFDRARERLFELFDRGIAPSGQRLEWKVLEVSASETTTIDATEAYLRAATRLINRHGYRGASVQRIASELKLTKGSFYHHLSTKDELMLECFRRSSATVLQTQQMALSAEGSYLERLATVLATLVEVQFSARAPLLRTTALAALPTTYRHDVAAQANRIAQRFAGMLTDGISERSIQPVDPLIASQFIMSMLNAAFELRTWAGDLERLPAIEFYVSTLAHGLFADPPQQ